MEQIILIEEDFSATTNVRVQFPIKTCGYTFCVVGTQRTVLYAIDDCNQVWLSTVISDDHNQLELSSQEELLNILEKGKYLATYSYIKNCILK